jgi:hypothetical protein
MIGEAAGVGVVFVYDKNKLVSRSMVRRLLRGFAPSWKPPPNLLMRVSQTMNIYKSRMANRC